MENSVELVLSLLSGPAQLALGSLSIPGLLTDRLAEELLQHTGAANGNAPLLIREIQSFPIWRRRTNATWKLDDDVRRCCLQKLNGSGDTLRAEVLAGLKELKELTLSTPGLIPDDYELQIARLEISLEAAQPEGVLRLRNFFDTGVWCNSSELLRVTELYLDENWERLDKPGQPLTRHLAGAYFMRGRGAYKQKDWPKAEQYLIPVWRQAGSSVAEQMDGAIAAHLVGKIWSRDSQRRDEGEKAYRESIRMGKENSRHLAQVWHSMGDLLAKDQTRKKDAESAFRNSIQYADKINDTEGLAQVWHSMANFLAKDFSRKKDAESAFRNSIQYADKINHTEGLAQVWHSMANFLAKDFSRKKDAESAFRNSIQYADKINHTEGLAQVWHSMANFLAKDFSRKKDAESAFRNSIQLGEQANFTEHLAQAWLSYANFLSRQTPPQRDQAHKAFLYSLELGQKIKKDRQIAITASNYATFLIKENNHANAIKMLKLAIQHQHNPKFLKQDQQRLKDLENLPPM